MRGRILKRLKITEMLNPFESHKLSFFILHNPMKQMLKRYLKALQKVVKNWEGLGREKNDTMLFNVILNRK